VASDHVMMEMINLGGIVHSLEEMAYMMRQ
jgi:hypothetical protein